MMASQCTEQAVQEFLMERGGRVQQMELIDHFLSMSGESGHSREGVDREVLKHIVDNVGIVKVENGVKFVCLNTEGSAESVMRRDASGHALTECNGNNQETLNNNCVNGNTDNTDRTGVSNPLAGGLDNDKPATPSQKPTNTGTNTGTPMSVGGWEVNLRERRRRESAPVIGIADLDQAHSVGSHSHQVRGARRVSKGSQRAILTSCLSEDSALEGLDPAGDINTPKGSRRNFIELMMNSSPQVRRSLISRGSRLWDSVRSDGDSASLLSSGTDEECASVTLDPLEHEWMLCASDGLWESLQRLLSVEPTLVTKRDFVTGFTCLHWAAKQGKAELLSQLLVFAKENAVPVNVNVRSSAGYTPLHLAAMHGHTQVVRVLLSDWEADPEARDYSGRRAIQYLPQQLAADLQEGVVTSPGAESDSENANASSSGGRGWRFPRVLQGNLNPLRLLNPPAEAAEEAAGTEKTKGGMQRKSSLSRLNARLYRGRHRAQIIHSASFRDTGEVGRGEDLPSSPLRTRPLSNLFG
ncbi:ankyrin repeat domain-containing protein SOWAHC [Mastacembelus armatus]|uniref:ankyrin repeat domain-containing protein SOWAHC n=1 Tax=Mastacembelus armatus TaxID=205130 RepID=UPI000E454A3C|nr:ankyrin repeat domain-containing protein SOWAHC [Mastacembelus armatus]XP_026151419.1 ankyrin repeat domain-containing protein SOWAHC [Mastacembelus armatus]